MAIYRSAQGKKVDMAAIMAKNEKTRAVGLQAKGDGKKTTGVKMNARGDIIDSKGNVVKSMTQKRAEGYAATVGNRSAQPGQPLMKRPKSEENFALTPQEKELEAMQNDDIEVEEIKAKSKGV